MDNFNQLPYFDESIFIDSAMLDQLYKNLQSSLPLLYLSNGLELVCLTWLKLSISSYYSNLQVNHPSSLFTGKAFEENLDSQNPESLNAKCLLWSELVWGDKLQTLYLNNKNFLDEIACSMIRVNDKFLAYELYHRIKANEIDFLEASNQFGCEPERSRGGKFATQSLSSLPKGLLKPLQKLSPGEMLRPIPYGDNFAIFQLNSWNPSTFDSRSKIRLLEIQLESWLQDTTSVIVEYINEKSGRSQVNHSNGQSKQIH